MTTEMNSYAVTVIWLASIGFPYLLFLLKNNFARKGVTLLRAIIAIGLGWAYVVAYAISSNSMMIVELSLKSGLLSFPDSDGASIAFAYVFGWVFPTIIVATAWIVHGWILPRYVVRRIGNQGHP